jgi:DNA-binding response OmpR family regulator
MLPLGKRVTGSGLKERVRVLLGEDDPDQRELLEELLRLQGYEPISAGNSAELIRKLGEHPDAVLMDIVGITSPQVRRTLRRMPRRPALLMVSGDPRLATVAEWLGADGYVAKPYEISVLLAALEGALAIREGRLHSPLTSCVSDLFTGA